MASTFWLVTFLAFVLAFGGIANAWWAGMYEYKGAQVQKWICVYFAVACLTVFFDIVSAKLLGLDLWILNLVIATGTVYGLSRLSKNRVRRVG